MEYTFEVKMTLINNKSFTQKSSDKTFGASRALSRRAAASETLKQELSVKYADWTSILEADYFDRVMQSATTSSFKMLDRRDRQLGLKQTKARFQASFSD
jgi:hypothetical protein